MPSHPSRIRKLTRRSSARSTTRPAEASGESASASVAAALQDSEQKYREIVEQAAVGISLVGLDGCIVDVNRKFCDLLGYGEMELLGRHIRDITHPEDYGVGARYRAELEHRALKTEVGS